jgi:NAD(P)-dependent dehydrogenase (short-subunit alcohol dehydrogenase family)
MSNDAAPLFGKAIVVTGAARGIGRAVAMAVVEAGADVVVNDQDGDALQKTVTTLSSMGANITAHVGSVSDYESARELITTCVETFGAIDGLVNNAGAFAIGSTTEIDEATWRRLIETNVLGTAFCGTHAIAHMKKKGSGAIVNVTSGAHLGTPLLSAYGASKGAVASLTYGWALELAPVGIRVNALSPMAKSQMSDDVAHYFRNHSELTPWPEASVAPSNNAPVVVYLLSNDAAPLTGQVVRIDGERLSLMAHPSVLEPILFNSSWTYQEVKDAFDVQLKELRVPLGLSATKGPFYEVVADYLPAKD